MKNFYKLNADGTASIGCGVSVPLGFNEYFKGNEPQELLYALFLMSKPKKLLEIQKANTEANEQDIAYMNTTFQADKESQNLIVSVLSAGTVPDGFYWLDSLNNKVSMTYEELQGLSATILDRGQVNFDKYQLLKMQVNSATTQDELDVIVW